MLYFPSYQKYVYHISIQAFLTGLQYPTIYNLLTQIQGTKMSLLETQTFATITKF